MAKKLKVWLNNKLNKRLCCTVEIKFYHIFITELVLTFFVFKYPNYFEFPKCGKRSPYLKILEIPGGGGVIKDPPGTENPGGWGGGVQIKVSSVVGVWIFSGTTQCGLATSFTIACNVTCNSADTATLATSNLGVRTGCLNKSV